MRGRYSFLYSPSCLFMGSCDKYTGQDELKVQDNNRNIIKEINQKGWNVVRKRYTRGTFRWERVNNKYRDYPAGTEIDIAELNQRVLSHYFIWKN